ncbi:hypothetical protein FGO68_gene15492 [Halteria grandinella]|uniref:Uncharacterized protein n=1 Tax=Halteria grandinella TaxID=5974 RepID=A0A8J8ND40_HALGN|nr:hypothetical protein FGO68_gene15492 [Halteria grandinella]
MSSDNDFFPTEFDDYDQQPHSPAKVSPKPQIQRSPPIHTKSTINMYIDPSSLEAEYCDLPGDPPNQASQDLKYPPNGQHLDENLTPITENQNPRVRRENSLGYPFKMETSPPWMRYEPPYQKQELEAPYFLLSHRQQQEILYPGSSAHN